MGSGDELQTSVCCSGTDSCRDSQFTGSGLRVLSCEGNGACQGVDALLAGDLSCNGPDACVDSNVHFQGSNEYPGFAFSGDFLFSRSRFFSRRQQPGQIPGTPLPAVVTELALKGALYS